MELAKVDNMRLKKESHKAARQSRWLQVYQTNLFNVSAACREIGVSRTIYYKWLDDPEFVRALEEAREERLDFLESQLMQKVKDGDITAIIFALKTIGKNRGYSERPDMGEIQLWIQKIICVINTFEPGIREKIINRLRENRGLGSSNGEKDKS